MPGDSSRIGLRQHTLLKPGGCRIKLTYANESELNEPLAKGSWTGTLTSNELVLPALTKDRQGAVKVLKAKVVSFSNQ